MLCVKAPMLATYSLLPIIQRFAKPMGVEVMRKNGQSPYL
jgi:monomeric isocitrate dehydrogenase